MASMYGKDAQHMRDNDFYPDPPTYQTTTYQETKEKEVEVIEEEPVECTPGMCLHPIGLLRWFQMAMFFTLQWLVQITCGGDACTMIMNVFGYTALGQVFVLIIFLFLSLVCGIILILISLNGHRAFGGLMRTVEKLYAILGIPLMLIAGILGTWMAVLTTDPEVNYQGRGRHHIRGQWIAAAVLEFLMVGVYIFDLYLQRNETYPFNLKEYESDAIITTRTVEYEVPVRRSNNTTLTNTKQEEEIRYYNQRQEQQNMV